MEIVDVRNQLARHPSKEYTKRPLEAIEYIVIHHSATRGGNAFSFAQYHVNTREWPGIGYHFVILEDGTVQKTNDLSTVSYHVKGYNSKALGICLVGDFTSEEVEDKQRVALKELCNQLFSQLELGVENIKGHNELGTGRTLCPAINMNSLREYIAENEVKIFIDEEELQIPLLLKDGAVFVAIRPLGEKLGYEVNWDGEKRNVYLEKVAFEEVEQISKERDYYQSLIKKIENVLAGEENT